MKEKNTAKKKPAKKIDSTGGLTATQRKRNELARYRAANLVPCTTKTWCTAEEKAILKPWLDKIIADFKAGVRPPPPEPEKDKSLFKLL